jgi:hypothetical protein
LLFVPVHYIAQGYLTSFGNMLLTWMSQVSFNLLALTVANGRLLGDAAGDTRRDGW